MSVGSLGMLTHIQDFNKKPIVCTECGDKTNRHPTTLCICFKCLTIIRKGKPNNQSRYQKRKVK